MIYGENRIVRVGLTLIVGFYFIIEMDNVFKCLSLRLYSHWHYSMLAGVGLAGLFFITV